MSSGTRTAAKAGKGPKSDKSHRNDKGDTVGKGNGDKQQQQSVTNSKFDDSVKEKVKLLVEISRKTEDEVCVALHECDYDIQRASNMLIENSSGIISEWETRVKKKKNRQTSLSGKADNANSGSADTDDWNDPTPQPAGGGGDKDKRRDKSAAGGGPGRPHGRGWRGRERHENDRNLDDAQQRGGDFGRDRRGGPRGTGPSTRGGGPAGRGRGGGRAGGRFPPRGPRTAGGTFNKPIETWDNSNTWDVSGGNQQAQAENWNEEWTTEEYTGSLADSKVFTPSAPPVLDSIPDGGTGTTTNTPTNANALPPQQQQQPQSTAAVAAAGGVQPPQLDASPALLQQQQQQISPVPAQQQQQVPGVGSLNAAQTQYLSQLTQQNSDALAKQYAGAQTNAGPPQSNAAQTAGYGAAQAQYNSYGYVPGYEQPQQQQQTVRPKTRARVPPPSKIPSSAVEMPGDLNSNIGFLDVQFGAMDFIENNSFDGSEHAKYGTGANSLVDGSAVQAPSSVVNLDLSASAQQQQNASGLDSYASSKNQNQSSISSALSQGLSNTDIPQDLAYAQRGAQQQVASGAAAQQSGADLGKPADSGHSYAQQTSSYGYQAKGNAYNSSTYSGTQTTSSSYVSNQSNNYVNNQSGSYAQQSGANTNANNAYPSSYSSASYASNAANNQASGFPTISQATNSSSSTSTYPSSNQQQQQAYQSQNASQSVYANSSSSSYSNAQQYNNYGSAAGAGKTAKDAGAGGAGYDGTPSAASTNSVTSSAAALSAQSTGSASKTTTTLAAKNSSSSVVSNIVPGVAPVMSAPYIMGQVPYFQQPVYSFEDMQILQQRLPHMTAPYYDMSYQTPTTLATVRGDGAAIGTVGGYSLSDSRFTRGDNNASPVPSSTLSQQTSTLTPGHQAQPILAGGAPPYFFAPTPFNTIATNYQFGTMYTPLPAGTNAHGTSNSNQYPKPGTYGSGYGAYDALSQTQDYNKGTYVANAQGQKGGGGNASSAGSAGNDLSAMYGKSHTTLGKVNSYEKQGFHSGTPPPFTGTLHGSQNAGLAPSGTGYGPQVYIPTMGPHQQHHSTQLMHQSHLPMDVRHQGRRVESGNSSGQRTQNSNQAKAGSKQSYPTSYWNPA